MTSTFDNIYIFNLYLYVQYFVIKTFNIMGKKKNLLRLKKYSHIIKRGQQKYPHIIIKSSKRIE